MNKKLILSIVVAAVTWGEAVAAPPTYSLLDLGPSGANNGIVGFSNTGLVLTSSGSLYATDGSGTVTNLQFNTTLPKVCQFSLPWVPLGIVTGGISHNGIVVLTVSPNNFAGLGGGCVALYQAGKWTFNQELEYKSYALGVNDSGQVIGEVDSEISGFGPPGCNFYVAAINNFVQANAINDSGQIAEAPATLASAYAPKAVGSFCRIRVET